MAISTINIFKIIHFPMYLTMFAVMLVAVVGHTERTTKQMLMNPIPSHGINALATSCIEPFDTNFCLNGGQCFNVTVATYSFPSCECANGFLGERCERKYLNRSYNPENYMYADDIITTQDQSNVDKSRTTHNSLKINIYVGSSAVDRASVSVILLLAVLLLHSLIFIVAV